MSLYCDAMEASSALREWLTISDALLAAQRQLVQLMGEGLAGTPRALQLRQEVDALVGREQDARQAYDAARQAQA